MNNDNNDEIKEMSLAANSLDITGYDSSVSSSDRDVIIDEGKFIDRGTGEQLEAVAYKDAVLYAARTLEEIRGAVTRTAWDTHRRIFLAVQATASKSSYSRGRPKAGEEDQTLTRVYRDISNQTSSWSPASIKKSHMLYRAAIQHLGGDSKKPLKISSNPAVVEAILLSSISKTNKEKLFLEAENGYIKTRQDARNEVKKVQGHASGNVTIRETTLWDIRHFHERYGIEGWPGRTPGQVAYNVLHHFSKPGDVCYFPFFGSGSEGDVAQDLKRPYLGWDIVNNDKVAFRHPDVYFTQDSREPWDVDPDSADLVFADPPRTMNSDSWSSEPNHIIEDLDVHVNSIAAVAGHAHKALRLGGVFAILMRQPYSKIGVPKEDLLFALHDQCFSQAFEFVKRIAVKFPGNKGTSLNLPGMLIDGFMDLVVYEKR